MRENYNSAFEITIGLEGKPSNDPRDPGGFTIWGLAKKFHPHISETTTIDEAKEIYLSEYWIPFGCDDASFPMDIILFDSAVNPQKGGNKELLSQNPDNWQDFLLLRMVRYLRHSKRVYVLGHLSRVLLLYQKIKSLITEGQR